LHLRAIVGGGTEFFEGSCKQLHSTSQDFPWTGLKVVKLDEVPPAVAFNISGFSAGPGREARRRQVASQLYPTSQLFPRWSASGPQGSRFWPQGSRSLRRVAFNISGFSLIGRGSCRWLIKGAKPQPAANRGLIVGGWVGCITGALQLVTLAGMAV